MHTRSRKINVKRNDAPFLGRWELKQCAKLGFARKDYAGEENKRKKILKSRMDYFQGMDNFAYLKEHKDCFNDERNRTKVSDFYSERESDFSGGTYNDLFATKDIEAFRKYEKENKGNFVKEYDWTETRKRRREFNEHDGNWDMSRQWDINAYEGVKKTAVHSPFVKLDIQVSFNCDVKSEKINEYGYFVSSLCNYLESNGYITEINLVSLTCRTSEKLDYHENTIRIKDRNEYMSVQRLLKTFNANFFRRVIFSNIVSGAEYADNSVDYSLGSAFRHTEDVIVKPGHIQIFSDTVLSNKDSLIKQIKEKLKI